MTTTAIPHRRSLPSQQLTTADGPDGPAIDYAVQLIYRVCCHAGSASLIDEIRDDDICTAIEQRDTASIFDWLASGLSYQGVSDEVASNYMERHGRPTWRDINDKLGRGPSCPKLTSYWHFHRCRYDKTSGTCAEPDHIGQCPLPTHHLRNGRLNQLAYSLFLFFRDVADGDLVGWIDNQLAAADDRAAPDRIPRMIEAVIGPVRHVYGAADKVLMMALSGLLIGGGSGRPRWVEVGSAMIAIDTLVHNFLHRTGILRRFDADHLYGAACYRTGRCADIIRTVADRIDARTFNRDFPSPFPRFVQHAIWRYCALNGLNVCNGNRIDDRDRCTNIYCQIYSNCDRIHLPNRG
jgi:hypothetical protein